MGKTKYKLKKRECLCDVCAGRATMAQIFTDIEHNIKTYDRHIVGVLDSDGNPDFAYTVGNWERHKLPELVMCIDERDDCGYLDAASEFMVKKLKRAFHDRECVDITSSNARPDSDHTLYTVHAIDNIDELRRDYTCHATHRYGTDEYPVMLLRLHKNVPHEHVNERPDCIDWNKIN